MKRISLALGNDRVLWLFGDTLISNSNKFIARSPDHIKMPRNSIGIMTGLNPSKATIKYYWGNHNSLKNPTSFFKNINVYAGKYHPELTDGKDDMIFTYATNTQEPKMLWHWKDIYYPRFIKIKKESF